MTDNETRGFGRAVAGGADLDALEERLIELLTRER